MIFPRRSVYLIFTAFFRGSCAPALPLHKFDLLIWGDGRCIWSFPLIRIFQHFISLRTGGFRDMKWSSSGVMIER